MTKKLMSSYARLMPNGKYEYGIVIVNESDRRKDRLEKKGESATFAEAEKETRALATAIQPMDQS